MMNLCVLLKLRNQSLFEKEGEKTMKIKLILNSEFPLGIIYRLLKADCKKKQYLIRGLIHHQLCYSLILGNLKEAFHPV